MLPRGRTLSGCHPERHQLAGNPMISLPQQNVAPAKITFIERHEPAQASFDGRGVGSNVVAMQRQTRFESQGVARPEPARRRAALKKLVPQKNCVRIVAEDFVAVLPCVAGPGNPTGSPEYRLPRDMKRGETEIEEPLSLGTLQRERRSLGALVGDSNLLAEPCKIVGNIAGVNDEQKNSRLDSVENQIIQNTAGRIAHERVLSLTDRHLANIVRKKSVQRDFRSGAGDDKFAHVRDIKQAGALADREMFR